MLTLLNTDILTKIGGNNEFKLPVSLSAKLAIKNWLNWLYLVQTFGLIANIEYYKTPPWVKISLGG